MSIFRTIVIVLLLLPQCVAKHQSKAPRGWAIPEFKHWLLNHPSPNSECDEDNSVWANVGIDPENGRGTTFDVACDRRLQIST